MTKRKSTKKNPDNDTLLIVGGIAALGAAGLGLFLLTRPSPEDQASSEEQAYSEEQGYSEEEPSYEEESTTDPMQNAALTLAREELKKIQTLQAQTESQRLILQAKQQAAALEAQQKVQAQIDETERQRVIQETKRQAAALEEKRKLEEFIANTPAIFYQDNDYLGRSFSVISELNCPNVNQIQIPPDFISSIKVKTGFRVDVYEHENYAGKVWSFTADTPSFADANDKMSSFKVLNIIEESKRQAAAIKTAQDALANAAVVFYEHKDYGGRSYIFPNAIECPNAAAAGNIPIPNDLISSVKVKPGYRLEMYEHENYGGMFHSTTESESSFAGPNAYTNDMMSSFKIKKISSPEDLITATFYEHENLLGQAWPVRGTGEWPSPGIVPNDIISSVRVTPGYTVCGYEHNDYRGKAWWATGDVGKASKDGFNDKMSSFKIMKT